MKARQCDHCKEFYGEGEVIFKIHPEATEGSKETKGVPSHTVTVKLQITAVYPVMCHDYCPSCSALLLKKVIQEINR